MKRIIRIGIIAISILTLACYMCITIVSKHSTSKIIEVGIVDTNLSEEYLLRYNIDNIMNEDNNKSTNNTHADMIVDTIKQEDENCEIYLANVLNDDSTGKIEDVIKALNWLKDNNVDIICMSLTTTEDNEQLKQAINDILSKGILVVASCLNYSTCITYPAGYNGVISIANCRNENATISIINKNIKDKFKNSKWGESSTSILTAYITGKISKQMSNSTFDLVKFIKKYNMT